MLVSDDISTIATSFFFGDFVITLTIELEPEATFFTPAEVVTALLNIDVGFEKFTAPLFFFLLNSRVLVLLVLPKLCSASVLALAVVDNDGDSTYSYWYGLADKIDIELFIIKPFLFIIFLNYFNFIIFNQKIFM